MRVPSEVRRINRSAKVKFLPAEEVINLKSGTKAVAQVLHCNLGFQTNPLDPSSAICKRTEALGKITTSKSFLLTEIMNPLALHGMQTSTTLQQQAVKMSDSFNGEEHPPGFPSKQSAIGSAAIAKVAEGRPGKSVAINADAELGSRWSVLKVKEARGKKVGSIPRKESIQEGPDDVAIPSEKVEASSRPESQTSDSVTAPSIYAKPPFIGSSGISFPSGLSSRCVNVQERDLVQIFPLSQRHPLSGPALKVIWKGSFEVLDFSSDNGIYEGFLAHPSAKISCKAYEFARQIAGVLQFRIHSRRAFWPEIFDSDCPDANDIAMYFYPGKIERSKRQYAFLLKLIEKHDLMLRSRMGHVELLVFPSKLLHVDSQKLDGSYFMWGVFRNLKGKKVAYEAEALPF